MTSKLYRLLELHGDFLIQQYGLSEQKQNEYDSLKAEIESWESQITTLTNENKELKDNEDKYKSKIMKLEWVCEYQKNEKKQLEEAYNSQSILYEATYQQIEQYKKVIDEIDGCLRDGSLDERGHYRIRTILQQLNNTS